MSLTDVDIRTTADVEAALRLGTEAGLVEMEHDLEGVQALWGAYEGDRLVGVVALSHSRGLDLVGWLAVAEGRRGGGLGTRLLAKLEHEARSRGVRCLWATARAPGFFLYHGYEPKDDGPEAEVLLADCPTCDQYGTTCRPRAVCKTLAADG